MKLKTKAASTVALTDIDVAQPIAPRWGRYGLSQFSDYARGAGVATLVLATAATALLSGSLTRVVSASGRAGAVSELLIQLGLFGSVFAVTGLVSNDRTRGWYRFRFAKPASPLRYYAQAFALRGLGLLAVVTIVWALCAVFVEPVSLFRALDATLLQFALIGSVTLLLSTLIRFEWVAALVLSAVSAIISASFLDPRVWWWVKLLHWVLPPVAEMNIVASALFSIRYGWLPYSAISSVLWVTGYAAAAFVAALAILKRREWAR